MPVGIGSLRRTRPDVSGRAIKSSAGRYCDVNNEGHWITIPGRATLSRWRYARKPFPKGKVGTRGWPFRPVTEPYSQICSRLDFPNLPDGHGKTGTAWLARMSAFAITHRLFERPKVRRNAPISMTSDRNRQHGACTIGRLLFVTGHPRMRAIGCCNHGRS